MTDGLASGLKAPGLKAFAFRMNNTAPVETANRAKNHYSLAALIKNENYEYLCPSSPESDENAEIVALKTKYKELEKERLELEHELVKELTNNNNNNIINELKKIINDLNININVDDIILYIKSNDIGWDYFGNNSQKKLFISPLRSQYNIKYGAACKLWQKMNNIYYNFDMKWKCIQNRSNNDCLIFISEECTQKAIDAAIIYEYFATSTQLFHYLRWTIKMQQIDGFYKVFKYNNNNKQQLIIFNTELRDNNHTSNKSILYILGINNDKITIKSPPFKMIGFMTATQIYKQYGIKYKYLPIGSRTNSDAFKQSIKQKQQRFIIISGFIRKYIDKSLYFMINSLILSLYSFYNPFNNTYNNKYSSINSLSMDIYSKLPQIKTQQKKEKHKHSPNEIIISAVIFYEYICDAIRNNNGYFDFIPIVSFDKHKTQYFIDLLLPIKLLNNNNNWIGIIFRDNKPISICIDCNDIKTKAKLYDASYNVHQYHWFKNTMTRFTINQKQKNKQYNNINQYNQYNQPQQRHKLVLKEVMYR